MIQVEIKLPGHEYRVLRIINDGSGTPKVGNYIVETLVGSNEGTRNDAEPRRITRFRRSDGWAKLVQRALEGVK